MIRLIALLILVSFAGHAQISLVKDIAKLKDPVAEGINPQYVTKAGVNLFFSAHSPGHGTELWKSNGNPGSNTLVKDINPGTNSSNLTDIVTLNGEIFFLANDGVNGKQLWKSDGTGEGTVMFLNKGYYDETVSYISCLTVVESRMFFFVRNPNEAVSRGDLWCSDGTTAGTFLLKEAFESYSGPQPLDIGFVNGNYYFRAYETATGTELWKWNGTTAAAMLVKDTPGTGIAPYNFVPFNNKIYFLASSTSEGLEIWSSDGTAAGTNILKDLKPGTGQSEVQKMTVVGSSLMFFATDGTNRGLFKSDGTSAGTVFVKNFFPTYGGPSNTVDYHGKFLFTIRKQTGLTDTELWASDGTGAGTVPLKSIAPEFMSSRGDMALLNDELYFVARYASTYYKIWKTDATPAGTVEVTHLDQFGFTYVGWPELISLGNHVYFTGYNSDTGTELWRTNGVLNNIEQVSDGGFGNSGAGIYYGIVSLNNKLIFSAGDENVSLELWTSDGTPEGTYSLKDINPGGPTGRSSLPNYLTPWNNKIYFQADNGSQGKEFWTTDGTTAGTVLIKDIYPGMAGSDPRDFKPLNDQLLFSADGGSGRELWITDGTTAGTRLLKDIVPGTTGSDPSYQLEFNGAVYFSAADGIWKTDGTAGGTVLVKQVKGSWLTALGSRFLFTVLTPANTIDLWVSDGTAGGTVKIKELKHTELSPSTVAVHQGELYFKADDGIHGYELWKTNGTAEGTVLIKDIVAGKGDSQFYFSHLQTMISFGKHVYFSATTSEAGHELWRTGGTEAETTLVRDINVGPSRSVPLDFKVISGNLYFTAYDGVVRSLWKTTGTECGTIKVTFNTTVSINEFGHSYALGETLYFVADDGRLGNELYYYKIENDLPVATICKQEQFIAFDEIDDVTYGTGPFLINASADSQLPVNFEISGPIILDRMEVLTTTAGRATIVATQAGNASFLPSPSVARSFCVNPSKPSIVVLPEAGNTILVSSSESGNQWFKDNVALEEATSVQLEALESGIYTLQIRADDCLSEFSDPLQIVITATEPGLREGILVYPTIVTDEVNIISRTSLKRIEILSPGGLVIKSILPSDVYINVNAQAFSPGLYIIRVMTNEGHKAFAKFVKY